jgi:hypothetical protein
VIVPQVVGIVGSLAVLVWTLSLVRRAVLSERFAVVWLTVSLLCLTLAVFPGLLYSATRLLRFSLPVNLLFVGVAFVQLLVSIQLSIEVGRRQAETRRLAEEIALLQARLRELERATERQQGPAGAG